MLGYVHLESDWREKNKFPILMIQGRSDVAVGSVVNRLLGGQQFDDGALPSDKRACVGNSIRGFVVDDYRVN